MHPIPSPESVNPSCVPRKVLCASYGLCLDVALTKSWPGFSCERCGDFQPLQLDLEEWATDAALCEALLIAAACPRILDRVTVNMLLEGLESALHNRGDMLAACL